MSEEENAPQEENTVLNEETLKNPDAVMAVLGKMAEVQKTTVDGIQVSGATLVSMMQYMDQRVSHLEKKLRGQKSRVKRRS